jgi:hypothetical protein
MIKFKMNKRLSLGFFIGLLFGVQFLYSQSTTDSNKIKCISSFLKFQLSWHNGFEWEQKFGKESVIDEFGGILVAGATDNFSFFDFKTRLIIEPDAYIEYKNYYNFFRRTIKQKKTRNNSADFLYGRIEASFPVKNQNFLNLFIIQGWGAQRSLSKKISIDYHAGVIEHIYYDAPPNGGYNYIKFEPFGEFSFFYAF